MAKKRLKRFIVPIFISNQGCPHKCVFCDQKKITGSIKVDIDKVKDTIETAIRSKRWKDKIEVAFYGGTFTNLPIKYMKSLLEVIRYYIEKGIIESIRISTRPDSINDHIIDILKEHNVNTVELGVQSLDDNVLTLSKRGHTSKDTIESLYKLKEAGFQVGIQIMAGLPGDTKETFMNTIKKVINLHPDMVRLYPTVVVKGTELERMYREGKYTPLSLEEAVDICSDALKELEERGIPVIRIGLMNSESLKRNIVAGPWHPSFGFLVSSKMLIKNRILPMLRNLKDKASTSIFVYPNLIPLVRGYKNQGIKLIESETGIKILKILPDASLKEEKIRIEGV